VALPPTGRLAQRVANPLAHAARLVPRLAVRGRRSGRWRRVPVHLLSLPEGRVLVARAARRTGCATCAPPARASRDAALGWSASARSRSSSDRRCSPPPSRAGGGQVRGPSRALPDPADHPVFQIEPRSSRRQRPSGWPARERRESEV